MGSPRQLVDEVLAQGSAQGVVDACLGEDASFVQRVRPADRSKSYRGSRIAKGRFARNKSTYKRAFSRWQRTPRARLFYKKLARFNQRQRGLGSFKVESCLELFNLLVESFDGEPELNDLAELAGMLSQELVEDQQALLEHAAWQHHYHWAAYYFDWARELRDILGGSIPVGKQ